MITKLGNQFASTLGVGKKKGTAKKRFKYRLVFRGRTVSRHYTKKAANVAQKKLRGSRVVPIASKKVYRKRGYRR